MQAQLQQLIEVQAEQNQLLKNQLRWLKASLLTLLLFATAVCGCLGFLLHERGTANSNITVVTTEPILEHPISLAENDPVQVQDATQIQFGKRITVPPMLKTEYVATPIDFHFPESACDRGRGCDGMCL